MQTTRIRVRKKGQVTLPQELRDKWQIQEGSEIALTTEKDHAVIRPVRKTRIVELPKVKKALPEYKKIHSQVLQDVLRRLERASKDFSNGIRGYPRFKPAWRYNSFTYPQSGFKILSNGHVSLSKFGKLRVFMHRKIFGKVKTLTIKRDRVGDWFVIITTVLPDVKAKQNHKTMAIDVGLKNLVMLNSGEYIEPPQFYRKSEISLVRAQKLLSRKKLGSKNRIKARTRLAKIHRKIERQRNDFTHKLSKKLVDKADLLVFEKLQISNMVRNHHLSKSILNASWSKLMQFSSYKASNAGKSVELINPRGTTQHCSGCGSVVKKSLSERVHRCPNCGLVLDRDLNASIQSPEQDRDGQSRIHACGDATATGRNNTSKPCQRNRKPTILVVGGCHLSLLTKLGMSSS